MITTLVSSSVSRRTICTVFDTSVLTALFSFDYEINSWVKGNDFLLLNVVLLKFFAQSIAVDVEYFCCLALVALNLKQDVLQ